MKYAHVIDSVLVGWYDKNIHDYIPTPSIEITDDEWSKAIKINANYYDGTSFINKDLRNSLELELDRINNIKDKAKELIISKYPDYKQLNIIRLGGGDLTNMSIYIDKIRKISNDAKISGIELSDINWNLESLGE